MKLIKSFSLKLCLLPFGLLAGVSLVSLYLIHDKLHLNELECGQGLDDCKQVFFP